VEELSRRWNVMHLVEIYLRRDAEAMPDQRQKTERDQDAPQDRIALLSGPVPHGRGR
jgi:hypothetical protein